MSKQTVVRGCITNHHKGDLATWMFEDGMVYRPASCSEHDTTVSILTRTEGKVGDFEPWMAPTLEALAELVDHPMNSTNMLRIANAIAKLFDPQEDEG